MPDQSIAYKCPNCNAPLAFDTITQSFNCDYCRGRFDKDEIEAMTAKAMEILMQDLEEPEAEAVQEHDRDENNEKIFAKDNNLYVCPTCGAEVITDSELSASAFCHYCHSPVVLSGRLSGEFCPDMIIPFKITKERALADFDQWTKKHRMFLQKDFRSQKTLEKIKGLYVPFWLADGVVEGNITADGYKSMGSVRRGDYIYKTESKYSVIRAGKINIDGVPADGSSKADDTLMESIEPFNYSDLVKFEMPYLSGHCAEKYDVSKDMVYERVQKRMIDAAKEEFRSSVKGYSRVAYTNEKYALRGIRWKYVMLPMWFLSYNHKGKMYYYAMNGQTGKYGGMLPVNKLKLTLFSFGIPLIIAAAISFLMAVC
ncbi:MAG: hypothetical protein HFE79_05545 [Ruminiclostridium sp.]|nr:hypothetical protein [Ruminiclostridium sp.]